MVRIIDSPNADKTLSLAGLQFIKDAEEEGGRPKLKAYDDGTGTATIGWGCTEGVTFGMKITVQEANDMLDRELTKHIASVHRLVKVPISQGLFDCLVSFFFNHGAGDCPTLLKAVNSGSDDAIRRALMLYTKAFDKKIGKKVTWPGLVRRRTIEIAHWAKMDEMDPKVQTPDAEARVPSPAEPDRPGWITTAAKSKSFLMQLQAIVVLIVTTLTDWGRSVVGFVSGLFGMAPSIQDSVQTAVSTGEQLAGFFQTQTAKVVVPLVLVTVTVAMVRHVNDKRELNL